MRSPWFLRITAGSATGLVAREVDWAATPLGVPSTWPAALRLTVEMCFNTRFPVLVTWGPELTMIYNDGYREMLGSDKHPGAMGSPLAEVWKEIWDDLLPSVEAVMVRGEPTWTVDQHLVMHRSGYDEDTYFTYSYSPIRDASDEVRGLLDIATETTERVVEQRRMRLLGDLTVALTAARDDLDSLASRTLGLLEGAPDVLASALYVRDDGGALRLRGSAGASRGSTVPDQVVEQVARTGTAEERGRTVVVPLAGVVDATPVGVMVLTGTGRRPWDDAYRSFLALLASTVGEAVAGTLRHQSEVDHLREVSDTLQAAIVPEGSSVAGVVARYLPAVGDLAVGGDWYDVVELGPGRRALVVGDCVGHGLDAAARMGQLRAATRALLLEDRSPADVLDGLDRFARTLPGAECTTVFCGVVDEVEHTVVHSSAGHLPPVLRRAAGGAEMLVGGRGAALGISTAPRPEAVERLTDGDLLVVCTDGLIERRRETLRTGLDRLVAEVAAQPADAPTASVADDLIRALAPHGAEDDVALVVYRAGAVAADDLT
ncbi:SpoIIE family protein phosphatase [Cellulomonas sp. PS-H5]|uniref:SpoIIE family protein phosphatase n=1 Tax=Cellulomonas sp. PS-H5 TaxID=2820400 RepID=UPI001C4E5228|nr:SpoIIE family protein phosphatase [Cellulomonas sp. PS-H5]MBW0253551.1 SpoIIE family protein phosphatase [Cellulomonas sp. PS-H5]